MRRRYLASVLDACVLAPMPVADTFLRLAENSFYGPLWSPHILNEVTRTLLKFGYSPEQAERRVVAMRAAFPEALVTGYEPLIEAMTNHPKDRHVLAAAVRSGADSIVTYNIGDFPKESLEPFGIECIPTENFLVDQYHVEPDLFIAILEEQARDVGRTLADLVALLSKHVPKLGDLIKA